MSKTLKIGGVRVTPKWDWSPDYERHVRTEMRAQAAPQSRRDLRQPTDLPSGYGYRAGIRRVVQQEALYRHWLATTRGLSAAEACRVLDRHGAIDQSHVRVLPPLAEPSVALDCAAMGFAIAA